MTADTRQPARPGSRDTEPEYRLAREPDGAVVDGPGEPGRHPRTRAARTKRQRSLAEIVPLGPQAEWKKRPRHAGPNFRVP
jgi:hypothetical protein